MLPSTVALAKVDGNILQEFSAQDSQKCSAQKSHSDVYDRILLYMELFHELWK
jgi:hypothetical protein